MTTVVVVGVGIKYLGSFSNKIKLKILSWVIMSAIHNHIISQKKYIIHAAPLDTPTPQTNRDKIYRDLAIRINYPKLR